MPEAEKMQLCLLWRTQNVGNTGTMGCLWRKSAGTGWNQLKRDAMCAAGDRSGPEEGETGNPAKSSCWTSN